MADESSQQNSFLRKYPAFLVDILGLWLISSSTLTFYFGADMAIAYTGSFVFLGIVAGMVMAWIGGIQKISAKEGENFTDRAEQKHLALFELLFGDTKPARGIITLILIIAVSIMLLMAFSRESVPLP